MKTGYKLFAITLALIAPIIPRTVHARTPGRHSVPLPKEELSVLNNAIKSADSYTRDKREHIDSLTKAFEKTPAVNALRRWTLADSIATEYMPIQSDSSVAYSERAYNIAADAGLQQKKIISRIQHVKALATSGIFVQANNEFEAIDKSDLNLHQYLRYLETGRRLYSYMRTMYESEKNYYRYYTEKYLQYNDSLYARLPENSNFRRFLHCEHLINTGQYTTAKPILEKILKEVPEDNNLYGMAAFQMAQVYQSTGDPTTYAAYLAKAATSDIKGCINDGWALPTLAYWMYEQGELNDAFRYINCALEAATAGNVRIRTVAIAAMLPMIDEAYREKINASRDELMVYFLLVTFLLIISGVLLVILMRQIKQSRLNARKLARTSRLQESYIGHFISLSSTYANRLQFLQQTVSRKISSGQADELLKIVKSGKFNDDQNGEFHTLFDQAFLDIYPNFIADINNLLRPEEHIDVKTASTLTPELRIYAFVRLGIEESTKIAQILNYSVSTVYAYRNRMRNRAIDRENFDRDVMQTGREE